MKSFITFLFFVCSAWFLQTNGQVSPDREILINFYNSLKTKSFTWNTNETLCGQSGITCDEANKVVWILLGNRFSNTTIPTEFGKLTSLTNIYLDDNNLIGTLPSQLSSLTSLDTLFLGNNQLSGTIPSQLGSMLKLTSLLINNNQLTGTIPTQLSKLTSLELIDFSNNKLTGTIPTVLGLLSTPTNIRLNNNQLTGTIPTQFGKFVNLFHLYLNNNQLTGTIPTQLGNLLNLDELDLSNNRLSGKILSIPPSSILKLASNFLQCPPTYDYSQGLFESDYDLMLTQCESCVTCGTSCSIAHIAICPANQYGSSSRTCSSGVWSSSLTNICQPCPPGYSSPAYSLYCVDINECATNNGGCDSNAICTNTPGSRTCTCNTGYTGNGTSCSPSPCQADSGFPLTQSGKIPSLYNCPLNFYGSTSRFCSFGVWSQIDNNCLPCPPGHKNSANSKCAYCTDINECATSNGGCSSNALCTNTIGSRTCKCKTGFTGDGVTCADINECVNNNGGCNSNATCTNTIGSRTCKCNNGYSGNGVTCADINECLSNNGGCPIGTVCTNTIGSRTCT